MIHEKRLISGPVDEIMCNQQLLKAARLELPWAPFVSAALGEPVRAPEDLVARGH